MFDSPFHKPIFASADEYVEYVREGIRFGKLSFGPTTADELIAVLEALPEYTRQQGWMPHRSHLEEMFGLPADYFDPIEPLTEREQERLLVTLANDDDFRVALRSLLLGGPAA
jgi:hypothetical protein